MFKIFGTASIRYPFHIFLYEFYPISNYFWTSLNSDTGSYTNTNPDSHSGTYPNPDPNPHTETHADNCRGNL